jgi:hypothetical protein
MHESNPVSQSLRGTTSDGGIDAVDCRELEISPKLLAKLTPTTIQITQVSMVEASRKHLSIWRGCPDPACKPRSRHSQGDRTDLLTSYYEVDAGILVRDDSMASNC